MEDGLSPGRLRHELDKLTLARPGGEDVRGSAVLPDGNYDQFSLLVFLRACVAHELVQREDLERGSNPRPSDAILFSRLQLEAYRPLEPIFRQHHTRLIFIHTSSVEQTREFLANETVPGELFGDSSTVIHQFFHLKSGKFRSLFRPLVSGVSKYGFKGIVEGIRLGMEQSHLAGNSWQQGGLVLLNSKPQVLFQHAEEHPADWSDMKEVLRIVGIRGTQIDHQSAVKEWLRMRGELQQGNASSSTQREPVSGDSAQEGEKSIETGTKNSTSLKDVDEKSRKATHNGQKKGSFLGWGKKTKRPAPPPPNIQAAVQAASANTATKPALDSDCLVCTQVACATNAAPSDNGTAQNGYQASQSNAKQEDIVVTEESVVGVQNDPGVKEQIGAVVTTPELQAELGEKGETDGTNALDVEGTAKTATVTTQNAQDLTDDSGGVKNIELESIDSNSKSSSKLYIKNAMKAPPRKAKTRKKSVTFHEEAEIVGKVLADCDVGENTVVVDSDSINTEPCDVSTDNDGVANGEMHTGPLPPSMCTSTVL